MAKTRWDVVITFPPLCDLLPHLALVCETMLLFLSPLRAMAHSYSVQRHHFSHLLNWFHTFHRFYRAISALKLTAALSDAWNKDKGQWEQSLWCHRHRHHYQRSQFCRFLPTEHGSLFPAFFKPSLWPRLLCWTVSRTHVVTSPTVHLAHLFHYNTAI